MTSYWLRIHKVSGKMTRSCHKNGLGLNEHDEILRQKPRGQSEKHELLAQKMESLESLGQSENDKLMAKKSQGFSENEEQLLTPKSQGLRENNKLLPKKSQGLGDNDKIMALRMISAKNDELLPKNPHCLSEITSYRRKHRKVQAKMTG